MATTPYTITKSDGSTLALIYPYESIGPTPGSTGASSTPVQVGCQLVLAIITQTAGQIIVAGNVATLFGVGFKMVVDATTFTVLTSTYNVGLNQTFVTATGIAVNATPGNAALQIFTVAGDQTGGRNWYVSAAPFQITNPQNPGAIDVGTYNVLTGFHSVYDTVSGYTAIPSQQAIPASSPFVLAQYQISYTLGAYSVLDMVGQDSLNWGAKIWENMLRMTENFADTVSPDVNPNIGNNTPLLGQIWFNTATSTYMYYTGAAWATLSGAIGTIGGVTSFNTRTGAVTLTSGDVTTALGYTPGTGNGTVTSVAATAGAGISVSVSNPTTNPNISVTNTGVLTFNGRAGAVGLVSGDVTGALGYTPYNATNPSGFITGNQTITLSGAVTGSGTTSIGTALAANVVGNGNLAQMGGLTIKGNNSGGVANPVDLSGAQAVAILPVFNAGAQGVVPASGGGTANYLRADGTWQPPTLGSSVTGNGFYKYPGGLIMQWGALNTTTNAGVQAVTFPIAFTSALFSLTITMSCAAGVGGAGSWENFVRSQSTTGFTVSNVGSSNNACINYWMAIGA